MAELLRAADERSIVLHRGATVEGTVVRIDPDEVLVDIGRKSEGVVPARELGAPESDLGRPLHVGDRILVTVLQPESPEGQMVLSYRRAGLERLWRVAQDLLESGDLVEAGVIDVNRGGAIVDVGPPPHLRGFVPVSQLVSLRRSAEGEDDAEAVTQQLRDLVGGRLQLKVIEVDRKRNRLIMSERQATRDLRAQRRETLLQEIEPGQIRRGRVSNLANFGAFIDLGGADGLVHISELSWGRVNHPREVLEPGQEVDVYVLSVDRERRKIALSLKRAQPDPWETIEQRYEPGELVYGTVVKQAQFGVFVQIEEGIEGLVHSSEIQPHVRRILQEGQRLPFRIVSIDLERRRLRLTPALDDAQEPEGPGAEPPSGSGAATPAASAESGQTGERST